MKFVIMSPEYNEKVGGVMVLHKLCHLLNVMGEQAYLHPEIKEFPLTLKNHVKKIKNTIKVRYRRYRTNPNFNTPVIRKLSEQDLQNCFVIYPEGIPGNPLKAHHVVRWFLHHPGYHSGNVNYNSGEIYFSFGPFGTDFKLFGSKTSINKLRVTHMLSEHYYENDTPHSREGTAYCLRKGKNREIMHDLTDSVLIDKLSHAEIGAIFRKVKYFISYDTHTIYTKYAIMCGCTPIVIPEPGVDINDWLPIESSRLGVAYGFEAIEKAKSEREEAMSIIINSDKNSMEGIRTFISEVSSFFDGK